MRIRDLYELHLGRHVPYRERDIFETQREPEPNCYWFRTYSKRRNQCQSELIDLKKLDPTFLVLWYYYSLKLQYLTLARGLHVNLNATWEFADVVHDRYSTVILYLSRELTFCLRIEMARRRFLKDR
jgi:hypothetical protein